MVGSDIFDFSIFHPYLEQISNLTHIFSAGSKKASTCDVQRTFESHKMPERFRFFFKQICFRSNFWVPCWELNIYPLKNGTFGVDDDVPNFPEIGGTCDVSSREGTP